MNIIPLEVFVSLILGFSSIVLWFFTNRQGDLEHSDRLALLPLDDGDVVPTAKVAKVASSNAP